MLFWKRVISERGVLSGGLIISDNSYHSEAARFRPRGCGQWEDGGEEKREG